VRGNAVTVRVKNASAVEGDDVVQLYVSGELAGFQRVHLKGGESRDVQFPLARRGTLSVR
jgi:hypothetical protein